MVNPISERSGLLSIIKGVQGRSAGENLVSRARSGAASGCLGRRRSAGMAVAGYGTQKSRPDETGRPGVSLCCRGGLVHLFGGAVN